MPCLIGQFSIRVVLIGPFCGFRLSSFKPIWIRFPMCQALRPCWPNLCGLICFVQNRSSRQRCMPFIPTYLEVYDWHALITRIRESGVFGSGGWCAFCYDFNTLAPKQAPTLSDITLSLLPSPTITLSFLSFYSHSYITLSPYFISDLSASDSPFRDTPYR